MNGNEDQIKFPWLKDYDVRGQELRPPEDEEKEKFPWLKGFVPPAIPGETIPRPEELKPTVLPQIQLTRPEQLKPEAQVPQAPVAQPQDIQRTMEAMQFPLVSFRGQPKAEGSMLEKPPIMASEYLAKMPADLLAGATQSFQGLFHSLDAYADKLSKATGIPKPGILNTFSRQLEEAATKISKEGLPSGFLKELVTGFGSFGVDIPIISFLAGPMGPMALPAYMAFHGGAEGGMEGAAWGAVQGIALHKVLQASGVLPRTARVFAGGTAFAGLGEWTPREIAKNFVTGGTLAGIGRYAPKWKEFKDFYGARRAVKKIGKEAEKRIKTLEEEAQKILTENDVNLSPEEAESLGGYSKVLDELVKVAEDKNVKQTQKEILESKKPEDIEFIENEKMAIQERIINGTNKEPAEIDEFNKKGRPQDVESLANEVINGERSMGSAVKMAATMIEDVVGKPPEARVLKPEGEPWYREEVKKKSVEELGEIKEGLEITRDTEISRERKTYLDEQIRAIDEELSTRATVEKEPTVTKPDIDKILAKIKSAKDVEKLSPEEKELLQREGIIEERAAPEITEPEIAPEITERVPERPKVVKVAIELPTGERFDFGKITADRVEGIRKYAEKMGVTEKLEVGEEFFGRWTETIPPVEMERHIKETIRDVAQKPKEWWEKELKEEKISTPEYEEWKKEGEAGYVKMEGEKLFGKSKRSKVYQDIFDRFHAIKKLTDIVKKEDAELLPTEDPYINVRNYLGVQGKAETKIFYKRFRTNKEGDIIFGGKSLKEIIEPVKNKIEDFDKYLVYRRVPELEGRGIKTGIDKKKALDFLKEHRDFESHAKEFTEYHHTLLRELYDAGLLTKTKFEIIKSSNQMYAPFQRVIEDLTKYGYIPSSNRLLSKVTSPLRRIKGSDLPIVSPLESTTKATYLITSAVERNKIANMIIDLRKLSPKVAEMIRPISPKMAVVATLEDGTKIYRPSVFQEKGVIEVWQEGKRHFYEVPKDLYDSMSQLTETTHNWLVRMLALPARMLRTGATSVPEFAFRNPVRDQSFAFMCAKHGYIPYWDFTKGLFNLVKKPEMYWKWQASGGPWSMLVTLDRAANQKLLKQVLGHKDYKKYLKNPIELLEDISMLGEKPTRLGVFMRAKAKGVPDILAGFASRGGSIDFARRGAKMKTISALYTFFNARLQAVDQLVRTAKENPTKFALKISVAAVVPSVINYLMNRDDPGYWEIPEWQRDLFWILKVGRTYLRIPKGDVGVIFGTTTEKILQFIDGQRGGKTELDKLAINIGKECLPISDIGGVLPTAFRAPFEAIVNKNFFTNRPIVPAGKERLEGKLQYKAFTTETAKAIGKVFNVSPAKIEHVVTGYGAGLARYALKINDAILAEMGIVEKPPKRPSSPSDIPIVKAFVVRDPKGFESESVAKFYDAMQKIEKYYATRKFYKDKGEVTELKKYVDKNLFMEAVLYRGLDTEFRGLRNDLSKLRKLKEVVLDSRKVTVEQKKKATEGLNEVVMASVISLLARYNSLKEIVEERKSGWKKP